MKNHASDSLIEFTFYSILHRFLFVLWRLFNKIKNMSGYCSVSFDCTSVTIITCHSVTHFMLPEKQVRNLVWNQILVRAWEGFKCLSFSLLFSLHLTDNQKQKLHWEEYHFTLSLLLDFLPNRRTQSLITFLRSYIKVELKKLTMHSVPHSVLRYRYQWYFVLELKKQHYSKHIFLSQFVGTVMFVSSQSADKFNAYGKFQDLIVCL